VVVGIDLSIDISTFPARIDQRRIELKKGLNLLNQNVVRNVLKRLVRETPVDTGRARSNWLLSLGSPTGAFISPHSPIPKRKDPRKKRERRNANTAISAGESIVLSFTPGDKESQVLWISNNTPYISDLNSGTSVQAAQGFVEDAVKEGVALGFRQSKGFLFAKGRIVTSRKAITRLQGQVR
jgi:hypothetical protein